MSALEEQEAYVRTNIFKVWSEERCSNYDHLVILCRYNTSVLKTVDCDLRVIWLIFLTVWAITRQCLSLTRFVTSWQPINFITTEVAEVQRSYPDSFTTSSLTSYLFWNCNLENEKAFIWLLDLLELAFKFPLYHTLLSLRIKKS